MRGCVKKGLIPCWPYTYLGLRPGVIEDEQNHLQVLSEQNVQFMSSTIEFNKLFCEREYADVLLTETVNYHKNDTLFTECITHNLLLCLTDDGRLIVVSDGYMEEFSAFKSRAYVEPLEGDIAELMYAYGGTSCITYIANGEVGYQEGTGNVTKYGDWYGNYDEWCAVFVSWCADQCNIPPSVIPCTASANTMRDVFEQKGRFYWSEYYGGTVRPAVGDIFVEGSSASSAKHVGIVVSVSGDTMYVVDGNCQDQVNYHGIALSDAGLVGFMRPSYMPGHTIDSWTYNGSHHWEECEHCGYTQKRAPHTLTLIGGRYICTVCSYNSNTTINSIPPTKEYFQQLLNAESE